MKYLALETIHFKNKAVMAGDTFSIKNEEAIKDLIEQGRVRYFSISSMLEKLSDSERDIYEERAAIIQFDGGLPREMAEIESIKRIIAARLIVGKCDICQRVAGCIMTRGQRVLCEVVKLK